MEKVSAIQIIKSRKLVALPGSYELKVTSVTPFDGKFICNLSAMTSYHIDEAKRLFSENDFQEAVNQNISASLRATDYIPAKGEIVKVYIENTTTKSGITGLFVTSLSELKAKASSNVSFDFEDSTTDKVVLAANLTEAANV